MAWIYLGIVIIGMLSTRATLVGLQTGLAGNRLLITLVGGITAIFLLSLLVWGFLTLDWYWPVIAFALGAIAAWLTINPSSFPNWYLALPFLYTATAIGGIYLWFANWPF